ncbi:hypothetical protein ACEWY4_006641 [Coilia grayii]|uniref:Ras-related protein Rab-33B n=1 Tax=Coilia grayii TaxID=363190 RepID=A0ABD1KE98_9TELE
MDASLELSTSTGNTSVPRYRIFKIVVIGDSGVGKTCLTYRFYAGRFPNKTEATIGVDFRERILDIEGEKIKIQLWDTAGQERFRKSMVQQYYRNVHAIILVFDVSNPASFRNLPLWLEECRWNAQGQEVPCILVGNKCDLVHQGSSVWAGVKGEQVRKFAEAHGMPFYLTSAKEPEGQRDHVGAIFMSLAYRITRQRTFSYRSEALGSFKLPSRNRKEKEKWACNC